MKRLAAAALLAGAAWMALREPFQVKVYREEIPLANLPEEHDGLTICHLSDLHCGPWVAPWHLRHGLAVARGLKADLVVITGDFVSWSAFFAPGCARLFHGLRAPLGLYGVLGNHDYWTHRVDQLTGCLQAAGVQVLVNESVRLAEGLWLCGVDSAIAGRPDVPKTMAGVPGDACRIVLCHEPDMADEIAASGADLQLSGHSHGGQVILPFLNRPLYLPPWGRRYPAGLHRVPGSEMLVYTNVGLGQISPPMRLNCPPEVSLLTLRAAPPASARPPWPPRNPSPPP